MTYETTLVYSVPLLRKAVFAFWRRSVGAGYIVILILLSAFLAFRVLQGDTSWAVGALGSALALGMGMAVALYVVHFRSAMSKFSALDDSKATFRAEESSFTLTSSMGTVTYRWSTIKEVWQFPDICLLLFSKAQFVTIPTACLPDGMRAFILQRVLDAGGKVR